MIDNEFIARNTNCPEIYIVVNNWQTPSENQFEVLYATKSEEDAKSFLKGCYSEDLEWVQDRCNCKAEELEENEVSDYRTFVKQDVFFSENCIKYIYLHDN